ncbi:MAG: hypothetical protein V2A74_06235, partial [bacterium]
PQIFTATPDFDYGFVDRTGREIVDGECIAQDCEARDLEADPRLARATELATALVLTLRKQKDLVFQNLNVTENECRAYFEANPQVFKRPHRRYIIQYVGQLKSPKQYEAEGLVSKRRQLQLELEKFCDELRSTFADRPELLNEPFREATQVFAEHSTVPLPQPFLGIETRDTAEFRFAVNNLGMLDEAQNPSLLESTSHLGIGQFSSPISAGTAVGIYLVAGEEQTPPATYEQARFAIFDQLAKQKRESLLQETRKQYLDREQIRFLFKS